MDDLIAIAGAHEPEIDWGDEQFGCKCGWTPTADYLMPDGRKFMAHALGLPEPKAEPLRRMLDGSPCWCLSNKEPHEGWIHAPGCRERRSAAGA